MNLEQIINNVLSIPSDEEDKYEYIIDGNEYKFSTMQIRKFYELYKNNMNVFNSPVEIVKYNYNILEFEFNISVDQDCIDDVYDIDMNSDILDTALINISNKLQETINKYILNCNSIVSCFQARNIDNDIDYYKIVVPNVKVPSLFQKMIFEELRKFINDEFDQIPITNIEQILSNEISESTTIRIYYDNEYSNDSLMIRSTHPKNKLYEDELFVQYDNNLISNTEINYDSLPMKTNKYAKDLMNKFNNNKYMLENADINYDEFNKAFSKATISKINKKRNSEHDTSSTSSVSNNKNNKELYIKNKMRGSSIVKKNKSSSCNSYSNFSDVEINSCGTNGSVNSRFESSGRYQKSVMRDSKYLSDRRYHKSIDNMLRPVFDERDCETLNEIRRVRAEEKFKFINSIKINMIEKSRLIDTSCIIDILFYPTNMAIETKKKYNDRKMVLKLPNWSCFVEIGQSLKAIHPKTKSYWLSLAEEFFPDKSDMDKEQGWMLDQPNKNLSYLYELAKDLNRYDYEEHIFENVEIACNDVFKYSCSDAFVAKLLNEVYKFQFVNCNGKKDGMWRFDEKIRIWVPDINCSYVITLLGNDIIKLILDRKRYTGCENEFMMKKIKMIQGTSSAKDRIIDEFNRLVMDNSFISKLDKDDDIITFTNGYIRLSELPLSDRPFIHKTRASNYVRRTTGYDYEYLDESDPNYISFLKCINEIFINKDIREFTMTSFSLCLTGSTKEEKFWFLTGVGANGKTFLFSILEHTLGDFFQVMNSKYFCEARSSSTSINSDLANKVGIRCIVVNELEKGAVVNTSKVKQFVSDKMDLRQMFSATTYSKLVAKCFVLCNDLPNVDENTEAFWRRICTIQFQSKFTHDVDEYIRSHDIDPNYVFPINVDLKNNIEKWKLPMMNELLKYHRKYIMAGKFIIPPIISEFTNEHQKNSDGVLEFINEFYVEDKNGIVTFADIKSDIRDWNKGKDKTHWVKQEDIVKYFIIRYGMNKNEKIRVRGIRKIDMMEDDNMFDKQTNNA